MDAISEAQHIRDNAAFAEKKSKETTENDMINDPGSSSDWFLRGDIETLERNVENITNPVDQGRIRTRIAHLKKGKSLTTNIVITKDIIYLL